MVDLAKLLCHCAEYYGIHHSECPVLAHVAATEDRLDKAERKIADALSTAGGRWCEWGSRAESVRDILNGTTDSAPAVTRKVVPPGWRDVLDHARQTLGAGGGVGQAWAANAELERKIGEPLIDFIEEELAAADSASAQESDSHG